MALRRSLIMSCLAAGCASVLCTGALAQAYPDHPIRLVVPFAPGGATDILARLLATAMGDKLGQTMIVENRPGAATVVAASAVAKAPPDGYTLLLGASTTLTLNPALRSNLGYDSVASFTPIGLVADMSLVLVANNNTPGTTLKEILAKARAEPQKFSYGSFGTGSSVHFGGEMLKSASGVDMVHVPFNGSAPSLTALMGGQVQVAVDTVVATSPLIKAGKIKPIAMLSANRSSMLPAVPTVAESGYPGFEMSTWFALLAPARLPAPVQARLEKTLESVMANPELRKKLDSVGLIPAYGPGQAVKDRVERELPQMRAVAARANIRAD
ncbi:Bug family tripartite tricarboxylate transporter substrate binding protein [Polaromonas jejuensis]|uniref:Bug family tripartite tricarboxylate transporter substrate binding protein n=1 Tax=Polaromonas jejuensis TaxID=457502 RepID=A0ABW0QB44_9BURK|nr:tripartite tricarboxylate transporter substrate binding protein [Polaromonas jejuensis]